MESDAQVCQAAPRWAAGPAVSGPHLSAAFLVPPLANSLKARMASRKLLEAGLSSPLGLQALARDVRGAQSTGPSLEASVGGKVTAAAGALRAHVAACVYFCRSLLSIDMLPCSHPPVTSPVGKAGGSSDPPLPY